jgi:phospholipid/cholesterol/gamma-HCH transport system permease protein
VLFSVFSGAVSTVQTAYQLVTSLLPKTVIGSVVSITALVELAPTITSLILAGKVGSNIASELGTMRVTEQIDALEVMGINSAAYLVLPKLLGALIMFPILITISAFLMHVGGIMAGEASNLLTGEEFIMGAQGYYQPFQITFMYIKSLVFGFLISTIAAYHGYYVRGGALEVGQASTRAVVYSCIAIVFWDYVLAELLL